jgi:hypothetical protein
METNTDRPSKTTGIAFGFLPPRVRQALVVGATVGGLLFVVHLLLAVLGDCQRALHALLALINGGMALMMISAATTGDPGGDTGTTGTGGEGHDTRNP